VVFNGEIYNYLELRAELEGKGHRFATRSDTEVIVHLYEEVGENLFGRLRGMFAAALWDARARRLVLGRDRVGKKPLYYFDDGSSLYFASELKSFFKLPSFRPQVAPASVYDYLAYLCVPAPRTIFKDVFKLEPGCYVSVDAKGPRQAQYWDLRFREDEALEEPEILQKLEALLQQSVDIRLMSEVPLGAFLSGGVDSSTVVSFMAGRLPQRTLAATIQFDDPRFDETAHARRVAELYNCDLHVRTVTQDDVALVDDLVWHYDEPFADPSALPTYQLCREARRHMKVALSGDGSDEVVAGYSRYGVDALENRLRQMIPPVARTVFLPWLAAAYPHSELMPRFLRARTLLTNISLSQERAHFNTISYFKSDEDRQVLSAALRGEIGEYHPFSIMQRHYDACNSADTLNRVLYVDMKTYLPERMLVKVDRASMAHSLEVRNPFLDHCLVEFLATLPSRWKLRNGQGKYILKKLMEKRLPAEILYRRKQGFDVPVDRWFRLHLREPFESILRDPATPLFDYFDRDYLLRLWNEHVRGTREHGAKLWIFFIFDRWHRRFLG